MRHKVAGNRLGRPSAQRAALLKTLVAALFEHDRIMTTLPKAKAARSVAEGLIHLAKSDGVAARRQARRYLVRPPLKKSGRRQPDLVKRLFDEIAPRYENRDGGYTRIVRAGYRRGDAAPLAVLELVE